MTNYQLPPCAPVLLLVFNRPEVTAEVFAAIRTAQPSRLYVAADGPRPDRAGEAESVARTRKIATAVDWPCKLQTLFREDNLGCKAAVSGAITWFFEKEERGIILEDDCLPSQSFFHFCSELLDFYNDETRVLHINGTNPLNSAQAISNTYFFSRFESVWGWATWRRAWAKYDGELRSWPQLRRDHYLNEILPKHSANAYSNIFDRAYRNEIDSWGYPWAYAKMINGYTVVPSVNLIENIGFGEDATHTKDANNSIANLRYGKFEFPILHQENIALDHRKEREWDNTMFRPKVLRKLVGALVRRMRLKLQK